MRRLVVAMMVAGAVQAAHAADMPDYYALRGPVGYGTGVVNWQGFYVGGQASYGSSDMNFANSTSSLVSRQLRYASIEQSGQVSQWPILGRESQHGHGFGGFVGYNSQWDDIILGVEASYTHGNFGGSASGSLGYTFADVITTPAPGYTDEITYSATSKFKVTDSGSLRVRAGYAWNNFLPYVFGGVSLGRADVARTAVISGTQTNPSATPTTLNVYIPASESQGGRFIYGYAAGLGVDMMLFGNLFGRVEWEYLKYAGPIDTSINTGRVGLGYKF
ncbi:outer membrane protein [Afipia carboxidovorans]|uniref:outer membrane protein n=1 Tax=Afipia carboxidovorans TaxID=40137 RepID=UPI00308FF91E|nr:outer membrane beta-barrel protein [Afipia carboxidovorans]